MNDDVYQAIATDNSLGQVTHVDHVKRANDIDRIETTRGVFFCKTYTKAWYGDPKDNAYPVQHEAGAYAALKAHGLSTPEVVRAELQPSNALGRPYLLLRALEGATIRQVLAQEGDITPLLTAAGDYLRRMHTIVFRHPGYVCSVDGPAEAPDPNAWRHSHWACEVLLDSARARWRNAGLSAELHQGLLAEVESSRSALEASYVPPRMLHGDCHVDQFFFKDDEVVGVVDMEVASAGAPIGDLVKFSIEAASRLHAFEWWRPFFEGYRKTPPFELFRLRLLCSELAEFRCQGWQGDYAEILGRLYAADTWPRLFGLAFGPADA